MTTDSKLLPSNIREFNEITAVIFAKLYVLFPEPVFIDIGEAAKVLGISSATNELRSGRTFGDVFSHTLTWLIEEGFITTRPSTPRPRCVLTTKALTVMNLIPPNLTKSLGTQIMEATKNGSSESGKSEMVGLMGNFFGNFVGSMTKTIMGS